MLCVIPLSSNLDRILTLKALFKDFTLVSAIFSTTCPLFKPNEYPDALVMIDLYSCMQNHELCISGVLQGGATTRAFRAPEAHCWGLFCNEKGFKIQFTKWVVLRPFLPQLLPCLYKSMAVTILKH